MAEQECHEEVSRRGEVQPCNKVAVAMRFDPTFGDPYPVCAFHARGSNMMSLSAVESAVRADMQREVQTVEWGLSDSMLASFPKPHFTGSEESVRWNQRRGHPAIKVVRRTVGPWQPVTPSTPNQQGAEQ